MDKRNLAFGRVNFILLAFGMIVVILGFILMSGPGSTEEQFNSDIFSNMRIKVGFASMVYAIIYRTKDNPVDESNKEANPKNIISQNKK